MLLATSKILIYGAKGAMVGVVCFLIGLTTANTVKLFRQRKELRKKQSEQENKENTINENEKSE